MEVKVDPGNWLDSEIKIGKQMVGHWQPKIKYQAQYFWLTTVDHNTNTKTGHDENHAYNHKYNNDNKLDALPFI